jgi:hypothetical protein
MLKLKLKRTVMSGRRAYLIESVEVDGRKVKDELLRTPNGEVHLTEGDTYYAADFRRVLDDIFIGIMDWSGNDTIIFDKVPY